MKPPIALVRKDKPETIPGDIIDSESKQTSHGLIEDTGRVVIFDEALAREEMGSWEK